MWFYRITVLAAIAAGTLACGAAQGADRPRAPAADSARTDSLARTRQDSVNRGLPGYVVDSVHPIEEELSRFRAAVGGAAVTELQGASDSRDALVRRFVADLSSGDTADLHSARLSPREFADLVYPSSPYTKAPYRQAPGFVWMQIENPSASGLTRLLRRRAEQGLVYVSHACRQSPEVQGSNKLWLGCTVRVASSLGDTTTQRLFGTIIERGGRFKFVSYANQF